MRIIAAILKRQWKDTLRNKTVLVQFVLFPVLTVIMNRAIEIEGMPENFFVELFAAMYAGMAPLTAIAAVISEEKEKNTLRVLMMCGVRPREYFPGIGIFIWTACMLGAGVICAVGSYSFRERILFLAVMAAGIFVSLLLGAAIGVWSRTQMMATSLTVPVMIVVSFLPMLSMFNEAVRKIAGFAYSVQVSILLRQLGSPQSWAEPVCLIGVNMLAFGALFGVAYRKCGLL